ncbi:MAG: RdgB/HAM1 family non-canonical purine NTP pyrophosphatase [Methylococcales symbiont of Iophon sp. n. MRB-2018]|nr:MAG: RdgB/HAM1 family non-canonical purine NTP pyrophosphatase [Methylococcales symbiont of Iophon sp. n. MRB-2018]
MTFLANKKIVLASGNQGKIREIQTILKNQNIIPQSQFKIEEAEETGSSFVENAIIKARNAALHSHLPAIADDSGLVVDVLNGAPGVISARYAGVGASDQDNLQKLLNDLTDISIKKRTARFVCVIVLLRHANDPLPLISQAAWEGVILSEPIGENGFGYDPVFWLPTHQQTSAQLRPEIKNKISHRGQALRQLTELIKTTA